MARSLLIMYWHGLGDLLCLTPQLRHLKENGVEVDILVRPQVISSHLMDECPYTRELFPLPFTEGGPSEGGESGKAKREACIEMFEQLSPNYTKQAKIVSLHRSMHHPGGKIERNSRALFYAPVIQEAPRTERSPVLRMAPPSNYNLEVFIPSRAEAKARRYIAKRYPNGYIFKHTNPEYHPDHVWADPEVWMRENLPSLPVFEADDSPWEDINVAFVMAREATHRVLSSSVFVHACDAMNTVMDVVHYGKPALHALPLDPKKILIRHGNHGNWSYHEDV